MMSIEFRSSVCVFFFFNDTATTEIYTLSLHDALPICSVDVSSSGRKYARSPAGLGSIHMGFCVIARPPLVHNRDRKSTRLNSSHANISYAVFCLKKKKKLQKHNILLYQLA